MMRRMNPMDSTPEMSELMIMAKSGTREMSLRIRRSRRRRRILMGPPLPAGSHEPATMMKSSWRRREGKKEGVRGELGADSAARARAQKKTHLVPPAAEVVERLEAFADDLEDEL